MQPENGGLSTIAHEYGHDLGLPDHYDTAGGQNGVEWWTLMAQSRLSAKGEPIGTRAGDLSAWDKLQLGWLDYEVAVAGQTRTLELGPQEYNKDQGRRLVDVLPEKTVTFDYGDPFAGERHVVVGQGRQPEQHDDPRVDLTGATTAALDCRPGSTSRRTSTTCTSRPPPTAAPPGPTWTAPSTASRSAGRRGAGPPARPTASGSHVTSPLDAYAGQTNECGSGTAPTAAWPPTGSSPTRSSSPPTATPVVAAAPRTGDDGWTLDGFTSTTGTETGDFDALLRRRRTASTSSYDKYLQTGPYNFGFADTKPLGGALPLPDRPAHLVLGHLPAGQQHRPAPGPGPDPAGRRPPGCDLQPRQPEGVAAQDPGIRLPRSGCARTGLVQPEHRR